MKNIKNKKLVLFLLPVLYSAVLLLCWKAGIGQYAASQLTTIRALMISGTPQLSYEQLVNGSTSSTSDTKLTPVTGEQFGEIICEKIGMDAPLYYGDSEDELSLGAGMYSGSTFPWMGETTLVGGHDNTFFANLEQLQSGDVITVATINGSYEYTVTATEVVNVKDFTTLMASQEDTLILYTCYPIGEEDSTRNERYLVYAKQ